MVVQKSRNDDELMDFLEFSKASGVEVRFIEMMNTGSATDFVKRHFLSGKEILKNLEIQAGSTKLSRAQASDPAERFYSSKLGLIFGLIASDTRPFCSDCNRLRLSADGKLFTYNPRGVDLGLDNDPEEIFGRLMKKNRHQRIFSPRTKKSLLEAFFYVTNRRLG